jgi:hypothetical protein
LTIVSKRASKVFSNPQHGGNRLFFGGQGAKLEKMAIFFQKPNYYYYFWGQCICKNSKSLRFQISTNFANFKYNSSGVGNAYNLASTQ